MNDEFEVFEDGLNDPVKIRFSNEQINGENHLLSMHQPFHFH